MKTNNHFHILIVDDEKFNIELAAVYLKEEEYKLSFALNAKGAFEQVMKNDISLILLDINMPKTDGFELCKMLKEDSKTKDIPIIFLTAQTDIKYISRAFEVGGVDYISKPFNGVELKARVHTHLQNLSYLQELKNKQSKLAQLSITDPLSKLTNALYFDSQIKSFQNRGEIFWIVYIKFERFEKINQVYGFYGANKIIRIFAKILQETSYSNAVISKLYGVGFGILIKDYDKLEIKKMYENIVVSVTKDKDIGKKITFSTVMYKPKDINVEIPLLYKRLQSAFDELAESPNDKFLFIN